MSSQLEARSSQPTLNERILIELRKHHYNSYSFSIFAG